MDESLLNQLKNYTVLCVEDEDIIRKGVVNTLKYYFKEVFEANDGESGYDLYLEYKPDLVISDIEMPSSGIEMVKKIRQNDSKTLVVMLTAYSSEEYLLKLINLNLNHYILKPINSENLLNGILKAFGDRLSKRLVFAKDLYFDMKSYKLLFEEKEITLRKRDIDFLLLLYKNKNQIISYEQIEEVLWQDRVMSMAALKTFVKEFRQRVPKDILENVAQIGYRLKEV